MCMIEGVEGGKDGRRTRSNLDNTFGGRLPMQRLCILNVHFNPRGHRIRRLVNLPPIWSSR